MRPGYTLIVEDDEDELAAIRSALPPHGGEVVVIDDAGAALAALHGRRAAAHRRGRMPDLLIVDLDAARVRALELPQLLRMHPRTALVPMLALGAAADDVCRARSGRLPADWFIRKPWSAPALAAAVRAVHARVAGPAVQPRVRMA